MVKDKTETVEQNTTLQQTGSQYVSKEDLNDQQRKSVEAYKRRRNEKIGPPKFKKGDRKNSIVLEAVDPHVVHSQIMETTGSADHDFSLELLNQVAYTLKSREDFEKSNFVAAFMHGLGPQDELEGALIAQMCETHNIVMDCMRLAQIPEQPEYIVKEVMNRARMLMDIFLKQIETLNKYRGKTGQQKVTVEHVHVHGGGQAVVGTIEQVRGEGDRSDK